MEDNSSTDASPLSIQELKLLPHKIINSRGFNDYKNVITEVREQILLRRLEKTLEEPVTKFVLKSLTLTIDRFNDRKSRLLVVNLIRDLLAVYTSAAPSLVSGVHSYALTQKGCTSTASNSKTCTRVFHWLYLLKKESVESLNDSVMLQFVEAVSILYSITSGYEKDLKIHSSIIACNLFKSSSIIQKFVKTLLKVPNPESVECLYMWGCIISYCVVNSCRHIFFDYQKQILEMVVKTLLNTKDKLDADSVIPRLVPIIEQVTREDFTSTVLPSISRNVLRSPETSLEAVVKLIPLLPLDLSDHAMDFGKLFATLLHSKDDNLRELAVVGSQNVAKQCSNSDAVEQLVKHYFAVFNGSEGKLTVITQKIGLLSGISALSNHAVPGFDSIQKLSCFVCQQLVEISKNEQVEVALIQIASTMESWCRKFDREIPDFLFQWLKTSYNSKASTSAVKAANVSCLNASLKESTQVDPEVVSFLSAVAQKSVTVSVSQVPILTEGLKASIFVLKAVHSDPKLKAKAKAALNVLFDLPKLTIISEKFISSSPDSVVLLVIQLIERLLIDHSADINDADLLKSTLVGLLINNSFQVRKSATSTVKNITRAAPEFQIQMIRKIYELNEKPSLDEPKNDSSESSEKIGKFLIQATKNLCQLSSSQKEKVLMESFLVAHLPLIYNQSPDVWIYLLGRLIKPEEMEKFVAKNSDKLMQLISSLQKSELRCNCIETVVKFFPSVFVKPIITRIIETLRVSELKLVTKEEFNIFNTPEGTVYDVQVIEMYREDNKKINIPRESKLYSYKDQMEEIKLRNELEKKQPKKEPELNKKQLEIKEQQLQKESVIRSKISSLNKIFSTAISDLEAIIRGNSYAISFELCDLIHPLVNLFSSPLCAEQAARVFVNLGDCVFKTEGDISPLGTLIGYVTLRRLKLAAPIDKSWTQEPLNAAVKRIVQILFTRTARLTGEQFDEKTNAQAINRRLTAPAFAYLFPLLSDIILSSLDDEEYLLQCLQVVSEHLKMREDALTDIDEYMDVDRIPLKNPVYLPRYDIYQSLIDLLKKVPDHLDNSVCDVMVEVAKCGSGLEGCAVASYREVSKLLDSLKEEKENLRLVSLRCLHILHDVLRNISDQDLMDNAMKRIFISQYDPSESCAAQAKLLWKKCEFKESNKLCYLVVGDIDDGKSPLRESIALGLRLLLQMFPEETKTIFHQLMDLYKAKNKKPPVAIDAFGRPTGDAAVDHYGARLGVALALTHAMSEANPSLVVDLVKFFVPIALSDRNEKVRNQMLDASIRLVDIHGKEGADDLLATLQKFLDEAPDTDANDAARRSVVILMGTLARHLDKNDPRVKPIVAKLIESLSTPSQIVQEAVANCLPHLIPSFKEEAPTIVQRLLQLLLESDKYGERKGAAYGIAGLVKGLGILSLKQLGIMDTLSEALKDSKNPNRREGSLFAFEMLCNMLGRLFEPYIIFIVRDLLHCFGDNNAKVRKATYDTAKAFMSKLSAHGVKLVLPSLLDGLQDNQWRTKVGSIELLGAMAFCAPKQLSSCLPSIVPELMNVMTDSHAKVQTAGGKALKQIGSVIRNPEIQVIVPVLLEALQDPSNKTNKCLTRMLNTKFVHFIDAPSLALIMPVIERAFQGRSTETRKMAAQIIGNMYSLTDQKDLAPYLPSITPGLKASLLDPVPEVRTVTARVLGAMVRGMGEEVFEEFMPWLMETLVSEQSSVDRSGAAQGLSEVIGGLGLSRLEKFMPEIIATAERSDIAPHVRDGYIMLFIYLPMVFNEHFTSYIGVIITPVLQALADENEFVRETALKAGQRIVSMYAETAIQLLLPQLEKGLFDENWRIRLSSVQLLGDLLFKISGVSGKMTTETLNEDDNFGTQQSFRAITMTLGLERRNRVLSGLYMGRSDVSLSVRQAALHVWKVVVTNTPRTLKEILPTLFGLLLGCLASNSSDKQEVAARTLGDLVRKLGERVLPEIIPILEEGLKSDRPDQRQGVCIGLSEIIASTSREMVQAFADSLLPTVTKALYDPLPEVRIAAAKTFDSLHSAVGSQVLDEILPRLLDLLGDPVYGESALDGLRQVMAIKGKVVLPYLIPQLTVPPVNTRALSLLSSVAGDALSKHLTKILPALLKALASSLDGPDEKKELEYCQTVILAVTDESGIRMIVDYLLEASKSESKVVKRASVMLLLAHSNHTKGNLTVHISQLLRGLILLLIDSDPQLLALTWETVNSIVKNIESKNMVNYVNDVRSAVRYAASDLNKLSGGKATLLPGFCLSKGIGPILPVFRESLLIGNPEQKELAALGLSEIINLTSADALKSSVVNIAGPLIRILGDRHVWSVKAAVLDTLSLLLEKVGNLLRPFIPQLQQTFLKSLTDPQKQVRLKAASALRHLVTVHTKADPVFQEILVTVKNTNDDSSVRETALYALRLVISSAGEKMSDPLKKSILTTTTDLLKSTDDNCRIHAAACLGVLCKWLSDEELTKVVKDYLVNSEFSSDWIPRHGCSISLRVALNIVPERILRGDWPESVTKTLSSLMTSDRVPLVLSGLKGTAYLFKYSIDTDKELDNGLVSTFARTMNHSSNEVKQVMAASCVFLARSCTNNFPFNLTKVLAPMLVNGTKERNTMVKAHSEQALISVLRLRDSKDDVTSSIINGLDPGAREALQDCIQKVLKRVATQAEPKEEEFDETLIV